jgi:bifunctional enzyme CysN/CysC
MDKNIIRLLTCGSVDDGKSTLIGRLLVETDSVPHDTIDTTRKVRRSGSTIPAGEIDFSLLTDGLEAEREQGITIDVAYRSMNLLNGKRLIISDAPGHEQYTRNMAVAASRADIGLILIDATKGIRVQTLRHLTICSLMRVSQIVVAINKLDAVEYSQDRFNEILTQLTAAANRLGISNLISIPLSALAGDNVVNKSKNTSWYNGPTLLEIIQNWNPAHFPTETPFLRIQSVLRSDDFRGVAGTVINGRFRVGDEVKLFPSGKKASISEIYCGDKQSKESNHGFASTLLLTPEVDATRGDVVIPANYELSGTDRFTANLVWLDESELVHSRSYLLIAGSSETPAVITKIKHKLDVNSGSEEAANTLKVNEIGSVEIATNSLLAMLPYQESRLLGNFVLVDRQSMRTVAAGMFDHSLRRSSNIHQQDYEITMKERAAAKNQEAKVIWLTGLSGSGKSTLANALEKQLVINGKHAYVLDGDNLRLGLNKDLGFTPGDRAENVRRVAEVAKLMSDAGLIVIVALVSPFEADRQAAKAIFTSTPFFEVFVDTPVEICQKRDPKGLYAKANKGEIPNFTGLGQDYEVPKNPDLILDGTIDLAQNLAQLMKVI